MIRKTRNFFLAVLGFFLLSVVFFIFSEVVWTERGTAAAVLFAPTPIMEAATPTDEGDPGWLIPHDQILSRCDHPWVIRRRLALPNLSMDELIEAGLSECYQLAGDRAIESHLWHQGYGPGISKSRSNSALSEPIELFFAHNADFQVLGLTPPETARIWGTVVHDLNGDATFNPDEPTIAGALICLNRTPLSPLCTFSDADGKYRFNNLLPGAWPFRIFSPSKERLEEFKYTNQLIEADHPVATTTINGYTITERSLNLTEFSPIEDEILLLVDQEFKHDFFLMQEWATYFAAPKDLDRFQTEAYYDLDVRKGTIRVYNGKPGQTYDQHDGLDASCPPGTEITSVAEGRVVAILYNSTVVIQHSNQLISVYGHGDPLVEENQYVPRGYPVALCNNHLTNSGPHLHFAVWQGNPWMHKVNYGIPAFADLFVNEEKWVANRHPLQEDHFVYVLQGGRGVWTEINKPHTPYVRLLK